MNIQGSNDILSCKHQAPSTSHLSYHSVNMPCQLLRPGQLWDSALWMCQNESIFCVLADGDSGYEKGLKTDTDNTFWTQCPASILLC
jgi:hypothetical protein